MPMELVLISPEDTMSEGTAFEQTEYAGQAYKTLNIKPLLFSAALWCLLAVLLVAGSGNLITLRRYSPVSLRYNSPVSGQDAYKARQYAIEHGGEGSFWLSFWHESKESFSGEFSKVDAVCIFYSGDASLVWPAGYLAGTAPGVTDGAGCVVSSALARAIWGDVDIVGKTVEVDGRTRIVRGVFQGEDLLALLSVRDEDTRQSYSAVELSGGPSAPARSDVESFIMAAGLGRPDSILMDTPAFFASVLAALPLVILAVYGFALCIIQLKKRPAAIRGVLFFALIGFAVLLPGLLDMLPGWMIPTRWSDFSFWGSLAKQTGENLREYFTLAPRLRDVAYKILLLKQAGISFISVCCALIICCRWHVES